MRGTVQRVPQICDFWMGIHTRFQMATCETRKSSGVLGAVLLLYFVRPGYSQQMNLGPNFSIKLAEQMAQGNNVECDALDIKLNFNMVRVSARPRGFCPFCCQFRLKNDIRLFFYTKSGPDKGKILPKLKPGGAARAGLKANRPTVIYVHGFLEQAPLGASSKAIRTAYLSRPEWYNVIVVDWSSLATGPWYIEAVKNTRVVAKVLADVLRMYHLSGEIPIETVHIIGFSLGAHVAGFTGKFLKELVVPRITGLDPAFPLFPIDDTTNRLARGDADFVDVIHTSRRTLGFPVSIGDTDFYPNFGRFYQPGCGMEELLLQNKIDDIFSCSHQRAWVYFVESVSDPDGFASTQCTLVGDSLLSCSSQPTATMGFNLSTLTRGDFYVSTGFETPFAITIPIGRK